MNHGKLCPIVNNRIDLGCACHGAFAFGMAHGRCHVTGNECGTDTWQLGYVCPCPGCVRYMAGKSRAWPCVTDPHQGLRRSSPAGSKDT